MSSEKLGHNNNVLKGDLGGGFDILTGSTGEQTDLGVARRFGGASAAYSLRDIGAMNGPVVNVRREPHDDDDPGVADETDFSASQVSSGALEDWVNGKLESTLPADVATAAAAYSLRKVKADYSDNAVRIRRTSDSVEVNVAFDSDDKVSASSAITNVAEQGGESGSTTATTVAEFLSEERTTFITNPVMTTVSGDITVLSNTTSSTEFTFTFSGSTGDGFVRHNGKPDNLGADIGDTVSFDITASGLNQQCGVRARRTGANNDAISPGINNIDNGTQTITFTVTSNGPVGYFSFVNLGSASTGTIRVHNLKVVGKSATVHTWYDQAGSYDAVQDTATYQPKIAENGALLADGIDFDGSDNYLTLSSVLGATTNQSIFTVLKSDNLESSSTGYVFDNRDGGSDGSLLYLGNGDFRYLVNSQVTVGELTTTTEVLVSVINNSSNGKIARNAVQSTSATGGALNVTTAPRIGATSYAAAPSSNHYDGTIKEIVVYNSDQSDNRFKIESNINNYYGLYNDANDLTQSTWQNTGTESFSSTSTDGFSYSNSSSTAFIGITLSETLALNDSVFISFNASGVTHPDSSDQSPQVRLRDSVSGGSGTSDINQVTNGFNAYTLTYNTGSSGQHIVFSEGDTAGGTVTISDFKVSRIARNGLVETWYDQSGNGRDVSQASASNQPTIVSNGGIYKTGAYPSIRYTDTSATYLVTESYSPVEQGGSGMPNFTLFAVTGIPEAFGFDSIVSAGGSEGSNAIGGFKLRHLKDGFGNIDSRIDIAQAGVSPHQANAQSNNATATSVNLNTSYLDSTDDELFVQQSSATSGTTTTTLIPLSGQGGENDNLKIGTDMFNGSPRASYLGQILEVILYTDSKKSELSDLTNEINNFYNI